MTRENRRYRITRLQSFLKGFRELAFWKKALISVGLVEGQMLPASGVGDIEVRGRMYHVWMENGKLKGVRFDAPIHPDTIDPQYALIGDLRAVSSTVGEDMLPSLSGDDSSTTAAETGTRLEIAGHSFSIGDLLDSGTASARSATFVAAAVEEIEKVQRQVDALTKIRDSLPDADTRLDNEWNKVQTQVDNIFGQSTGGPVVDLGRRPRDDEDLRDGIEDILNAHSSHPAFVAATRAGGGGVFERAALSEADAVRVFGASMREASIVFGSTGPTRYGAVSITGRDIADGDAYYKRGPNLGNGDVPEIGAVGAFSYATTDDLQRTRHVQPAGIASYRGGITAVSGDGKLYTGDIELEVRFSANQVSGLVTNLRSTDGQAWTHSYGTAKSILLPVATNLSNEGHWSSGNARQAEMLFGRRVGSPAPQRIDGTFAGELLGRGDESGDWAHGTGSVGTQDQADSAGYLAGSFGAQRSDGIPPPSALRDDGSTHASIGIYSFPPRPEIANGHLVVTMDRVGRYLEATKATKVPEPNGTMRTVWGAEEDPTKVPGGFRPESLGPVGDLKLLDGEANTSDRESVTVKLRQSLAAIVANPQTLLTVNGPHRQVELAVAEIERQKETLEKLLALSGAGVPAAEEQAWRRIQQAVLRIFHHVLPKLEQYDDRDALGLIDEVLDAFSSQSKLAAALNRNGRGVFSDVTQRDAVSEPPASVIWNRHEVQMEIQGGATDSTRWGAWRLKADHYAARGQWEDIPPASTESPNQPSRVVWSQLPPTKWLDRNDPRFPGGGSAEFVGGTTASLWQTDSVGPVGSVGFYDGKVTVTATWLGAWNGRSGPRNPAGTLTMSVTELTNEYGDPVPRPSGLSSDNYSIVFRGNIPIFTQVSGSREDEVIFVASTNFPPNRNLSGLSVDFSDRFLGNSGSATRASIGGQFVGMDREGPKGVIGADEVVYQGASEYQLYGAFGADRP